MIDLKEEMSNEKMQTQEAKIAQLQDILIQLKKGYSLAIREAWIDGFENGCSKDKEALEYSANHYGNSDFRKRLKGEKNDRNTQASTSAM